MRAEVPPEKGKSFRHEATSPVCARGNQNLVTGWSRGVRETGRLHSLDALLRNQDRAIRGESELNGLSGCSCQRFARPERAWGCRCGHCEEPPRWQIMLALNAPSAIHCNFVSRATSTMPPGPLQNRWNCTQRCDDDMQRDSPIFDPKIRYYFSG